MKKNILYALFGIVFAGLSPPQNVSAQYTRPLNEQEEKLLYAEFYEIGGCANGICDCIVAVRRDGAGVDITAYDREWRNEYALWQNIRIVKDSRTTEVSVETKYRMVPKARGFTIAIESAYDVFARKCREDARWLPPEVKKFFFGQYGIE